MIKSMTGYGASHYEASGLRIDVEIKTLNSKFLDAMVKLPKEFADKEVEIKARFGETLQRGKVNFSLEYALEGDSSAAVINEKAFLQYYKALKSLGESTNNSDQNFFELALQFPDVANPDTTTPSEEQWAKVSQVIDEAIKACDEHRIAEGKKLLPTLEQSINEIGNRLSEVEKTDPERIENIKNRIGGNLREHLPNDSIDENRFEQEVIYFLEKLDINEEKVRLKSHLNYFLEILDSKSSQGKKLGFITQEIGREINTIGSKANNATIQHLVVDMKEELEKIREQLLNII